MTAFLYMNNLTKRITKDFQVKATQNLLSFDGTVKTRKVKGFVCMGDDANATLLSGTNATATAYKSAYITLFSGSSRIITNEPVRNIIQATQSTCLGYWELKEPCMINWQDSKIEVKNTAGNTSNYIELTAIYCD